MLSIDDLKAVALPALRHRLIMNFEASAEGIVMNFAAIEKMPNTFLGHRLMVRAETMGGAALQHELADALFQAYFQQGKDVGDLETLLTIGAGVGLDAQSTRGYLAGDGGIAQVQAELDRAVDIGVSGVPCFLLGGTFPIPGAQNAEVMASFITRAKLKLVAPA